MVDLSLDEIRAVFRVVVDCCRDGKDVYSWNQTLVNHLHQQLDSVFTASFIFPAALDKIRLNDAEMFCERWEYLEFRPRWQELYAAGEMPHLMTVVKFFEGFADGRTARRCDLIDDASWATAEEFTNFRSSCGQDDILMSAYVVPHTAVLHCLSVNRPLNGSRFTEQQCQVVRLLHEEVVKLIGQQLSLTNQGIFRSLPPRLRQVFEGLMQGNTEQEIATELGISKHTVHDYVNTIYRRFEVRNRNDLVATAYQQGWKSPPSH